MTESEKVHLEKLRKHAQETRKFFSNKEKPERERAVCRAFLRAIGVTFKECELIAPTEEPADVAFRTAKFQIREMLKPGRKRGDEWKQKEMKYSEANSIDDTLEPYSAPVLVSLGALVPEIVEALSEKSHKYGVGCKDIDALVYINVDDRYLAPESDMPSLRKLQSQGWRSVSFVFSPYGVVLFATPDAPDFLNSIEAGKYMKWSNIETLFDV